MARRRRTRRVPNCRQLKLLCCVFGSDAARSHGSCCIISRYLFHFQSNGMPRQSRQRRPTRQYLTSLSSSVKLRHYIQTLTDGTNLLTNDI
jgi:hypothetical protein